MNTLEGDGANIFRVPFDMAQARITGAPVPVTAAPGINFSASASADGAKIVFGNASNYNINLWAMNVEAGSGAVTGEPRRLTHGLVDRTAPSPSADSKLLVYKANSGRTQDMRVLDLTTGKETRIGEVSDATPPVISQDGAKVAYAVREGEGLSMYAVPAEGGVPRRLCSGCGRPIQWFANGTRILYDEAAKNTEIGFLDVASAKTNALLRTKENRIFTPRLSPDGRLLCFTLVNSSREARTRVVRFSDQLIPESEWKALTQGPRLDERQPFWAADGRLLYFLSDRDGYRCVWALRLDPGFLKAAGNPFPAHHLHQFRHTLLDFRDVAEIGLSVAGKTMYLAVREIESNIWLAERKTQGRQ